MPGAGRSAGRVSIRVVPDSTGFRADLKKTLDRIEKVSTVQIGVTADASKFRESLKGVQEETRKVRPEIPISADTDRFKADLKLALRKISSDPAKLAIDLQIEKAEADLKAFRASKGTGPLTIEVQAEVDQAERDTRRLVDSLKRKSIDIDSKDAEDKIKKLRDDAAKKLQVTIAADLNAKKVKAELALASRRRTVEFLAKINKPALAATGAALARLSGGRVLSDKIQSIGTALSNLDRSTPKIAAVGLALSSLGSLGLSSVGGLLNVASSLTAVAGAGIALPGILAGGAVALGVMTAALKDAGTQLKSLAPAFASLQDSISAKFWNQAKQPILDLVNKQLPTLRTGLATTATQLGGLVSAFTTSLSGALSGGVLKSLLDNLNAGLGNARDGASAMATALITIGQAGSQYIPALGTAFSNVAGKFNAFVSEAASDGRLQQWIDGGLTALQQLGTVVGNVAKIVGGLFKAAQASGGGGLAALGQALGVVADVINGPAFQTTLTTLFTGAAQGAAILSQAIAPIGALLGALAPTIAQIFQTGASAVLVLVNALSQLLSNPAVAGGLSALFDGILSGVQALAPGLVALAPALGAIAGLVGTVASTLGSVLGSALSALAPVLTQVVGAVGPLVTVLGGALVGAIQAVVPVLGPLVSALVSGLTPIIAALVPIIAQLAPYIATLAGVFVQLIPPVLAIVGTLVSGLGPILAVLLPVLTQIAQAVGSFLVAAFTAFQPVIAQIVAVIPQLLGVFQVLGPVIGTVLSALTPLLPVIAELISTIVETATAFAPTTAQIQIFAAILGTVVKVAVGIAVAVIGTLLQVVSTVIKVIVALFKGDFSSIPGIVSKALNKMASFVNSVTGGVLGKIGSFISGVVGKIATGFANVVSNVKTAMTNFGNAVKTKISEVTGFFSSLPGKIVSALGNLGSLLVSAGADVVRGFISGIRGAIGGAVAAAASLAKSALSAAKSALGINSPSKEFIKVGKSVNEGFAKGITGTRAQTVAAINNVIDALKNAYAKRNDRIKGIDKQLDSINRTRLRAQQRADAASDRYDAAKTAKARKLASVALKNARADVKRYQQQAKDLRSEKSALTNFTKADYTGLLKNLRTERVTLDKIAKQRDALTAKIKTATDKLSAAIKLRDDYSKSVKSGITDLGNVTNFQSSNGRTDANFITTSLQAAVDKAKKFSELVKKLKAQGLNNTALKQIVDAGADAGSSVAQALLDGGASTIKKTNQLQTQLNAIGTDLGKYTSGTFYQAGVDSAKGLLAGLKSQKKALDDQATAIGKALAKAVKKALGIKSPSRVFRREVGRMIPAGIVAGLKDGTPELTTQVQKLVKLPSVGSSRGLITTPVTGVAGAGLTITGGTFGYDPGEIFAEYRRQDRRTRNRYNLQGVAA